VNVRFLHLNHRALRNAAVGLVADPRGAIAIEYGLLAALVAVVVLGSIKALGLNLAGLPLGAIVTALS
jgi:Flp pilus assembly pilin Flp